MDPPVSDVTFFCIKGGQLGPRVGDVTFLHQRRSVVACVNDVTFLDHSWHPLRIACACLYRFILTTNFLKGCICLFVMFYPHHQFLIGCVCLFVMLYPHHQFSKGCVCLLNRRRKADVENTPKLYSGPTIQSRPCRP